MVGSVCFLDATFLEVTTSDNASFQFVEFAGGSLFGFEYKFNGDNEFVLVWGFAKDKGTMVDEVLDFHADSVQPGGANIVIKFEDSFKGLWFREIFLNRIHGVSVWSR